MSELNNADLEKMLQQAFDASTEIYGSSQTHVGSWSSSFPAIR